MGYFLKNRQLQSGSTSVAVPTGTTIELPANPIAGMITYNSTSNVLQVYNGSSWQTLSTLSGITYTVDSFTGTGSQVAYTMSFTPTNAQQIQVFVGGLYQVPTTNYTVSSTTITFSSAPPLGATVNIIHTTQ
jgi:hypothetical protein